MRGYGCVRVRRVRFVKRAEVSACRYGSRRCRLVPVYIVSDAIPSNTHLSTAPLCPPTRSPHYTSTRPPVLLGVLSIALDLAYKREAACWGGGVRVRVWACGACGACAICEACLCEARLCGICGIV